jgi:5'-methylthioadenosine phosphorylase
MRGDVMSEVKIAVIGGSGVYSMEGLKVLEERIVSTPFGDPSSPILIGELQGIQIAFLARHGMGHTISPTEVNYRANIYALKVFGVERILSISACGSLREDYAPGDVVLPSQLYDHTVMRDRTFFENGLVAHVNVATPFCPELTAFAAAALDSTGACVHSGGSFITIEGPRFSTKAESDTYRSWGQSIIGMTTSPEAFLAKEAEICYVVLAHVTDYDVWNLDEESVNVEMVVTTLKENTQLVKRAIIELVGGLPAERSCNCANALQEALITDPAAVSDEAKERLSPIVGRYLD